MPPTLAPGRRRGRHPPPPPLLRHRRDVWVGREANTVLLEPGWDPHGPQAPVPDRAVAPKAGSRLPAPHGSGFVPAFVAARWGRGSAAILGGNRAEPGPGSPAPAHGPNRDRDPNPGARSCSPGLQSHHPRPSTGAQPPPRPHRQHRHPSPPPRHLHGHGSALASPTVLALRVPHRSRHVRVWIQTPDTPQIPPNHRPHPPRSQGRGIGSVHGRALSCSATARPPACIVSPRSPHIPSCPRRAPIPLPVPREPSLRTPKSTRLPTASSSSRLRWDGVATRRLRPGEGTRPGADLEPRARCDPSGSPRSRRTLPGAAVEPPVAAFTPSRSRGPRRRRARTGRCGNLWSARSPPSPSGARVRPDPHPTEPRERPVPPESPEPSRAAGSRR